jgi:methylated-DNA-[protein]-cysteine S-methyltransferase
MRSGFHNGFASTVVKTPIGGLRVVASARGIRRIAFGAPLSSAAGADAGSKGSAEARRHLAAAVKQLREYFAGRRAAFELPLDLEGTAEQRRVWQELRAIPFGTTASYGEIARRIGSPAGARAVGRACAMNPVPVVVPCHRVVGADGSLHGFGGGLWRKQRLLEHEGARLRLTTR